MQEPGYKSPIRDVSNMKYHLIEAWSGVERIIVADATNEWH